MYKFHKLIIAAGFLLAPVSVTAATGYFDAPGQFGSVGQAENQCLVGFRNNPFSFMHGIPCFAHAQDW